MKCVNKSHPDFRKLVKYFRSELETELLVNRFQRKFNTDIFPTKGELDSLNRDSLNTILETGFLKDMGFESLTVDNVNDFIDTNDSLAISMLDKLVIKEETFSDSELATATGFLAFNLLSKENNKLKSNLRYMIRNWDGYSDSFEKNKEKVSKEEGFIPDSKSWYNKVRDLVIVDFLSQSLIQYHRSPSSFDKIEARKWSKDDFTLVQKLIKQVYKLLTKLNLVNNRERLENIGNAISYEVLSNNYDIFDYGVVEPRVFYETTLAKDSRASEIVNKMVKDGYLLTGSLSYRKTGSVFRSEKETLHDLDYVVPFKLLPKDFVNFVTVMRERSKDGDSFIAAAILKEFKKTNLFRDLSAKFGFRLENYFFGPDGYKDMTSLTVTGIIDGVYNEQGEYKEGTGYIIDLFLRLSPTHEDTDIEFKKWRDVFIAKLAMNRYKDIKDFVNFKPNKKSLPKYAFKYYPDHNFTLAPLDIPTKSSYRAGETVIENTELNRILAIEQKEFEIKPFKDYDCG